MGQGPGRMRCAAWGGVSLGVGTLAYALFSPSSVGCSTNVVVLTHGTVTERGCAAYSVMAAHRCRPHGAGRRPVARVVLDGDPDPSRDAHRDEWARGGHTSGRGVARRRGHAPVYARRSAAHGHRAGCRPHGRTARPSRPDPGLVRCLLTVTIWHRRRAGSGDSGFASTWLVRQSQQSGPSRPVVGRQEARGPSGTSRTMSPGTLLRDRVPGGQPGPGDVRRSRPSVGRHQVPAEPWSHPET